MISMTNVTPEVEDKMGSCVMRKEQHYIITVSKQSTRKKDCLLVTQTMEEESLVFPAVVSGQRSVILA